MNTMTATSERLTRLGILREPDLDPRTETWRTRVPLGYVDGGDVYEYVKCSPVGGVDPEGLRFITAGDSDRWEKIGQYLYRAKEDGADLRVFSQMAFETDTSWQGAWPVFEVDPAKSRKLYNGNNAQTNFTPGKAASCDIYDVSSMFARGGSISVVFNGAGDVKAKDETRRLTNYTGYTAYASSAKALAEQIRTAAKDGESPISSLSIASHSFQVMGRGIAGTLETGLFSTAWLWNVSGFRSDKPYDFDKAVAKEAPPNLWFSKGAAVRFLGCNSQSLAAGFAGEFLHPGAIAWGTKNFFFTDGTMGWFKTTNDAAAAPVAPGPRQYNELIATSEWWSSYKGKV